MPEHSENIWDQGLGPLVVKSDDKLLLRGWRSLSLINIAAVLLPISLGGIALFGGGWWRLLALTFFSFATYGCWAIYRGTFSKIHTLGSSIFIDGFEHKKSSIERFDGRRVCEPSRMDDVESGVELWMITKGGNEVPVIQMSGAARIESIAAYLNEKLNET